MLEAMNSLVQAAKVRARGYRTTENFITMAYLVCGKLTFNLPTSNSEEPTIGGCREQMIWPVFGAHKVSALPCRGRPTKRAAEALMPPLLPRRPGGPPSALPAA